MKAPTFASLFTGGGLVDVGAIAAGLQHIWGVEIDGDIVAVARANGLNVLPGDVCSVNFERSQRPDVLHVSPPCPNFSVAKQGREESAEDTRMALAVGRALTELQPKIFTLENVWGYRRSASWRVIRSVLEGMGYMWDINHINAADYAVPQTRRRMWVRAVRGSLLPPLPAPEPWEGWYQAVEDLLPGCPESELANWQKERLHDHPIVGPLLVGAGGWDDGVVTRDIGNPAMTVTANKNQGSQLRAVLVGDRFAEYDDGETIRTPQNVADHRPGFTVPAKRRGDWRAIFPSARVVQFTSRCLARLQSIPDSYELPESKTLATQIIGNAVPPPLYQKLIAPLVALL